MPPVEGEHSINDILAEKFESIEPGMYRDIGEDNTGFRIQCRRDDLGGVLRLDKSALNLSVSVSGLIENLRNMDPIQDSSSHLRFSGGEVASVEYIEEQTKTKHLWEFRHHKGSPEVPPNRSADIPLSPISPIDERAIELNPQNEALLVSAMNPTERKVYEAARRIVEQRKEVLLKLAEL